jgi:hypothetical protein
MTSDLFQLLAKRNATLKENQKVDTTQRPRPNPNPNVTSPDPRSWYRPFQRDVLPPVVNRSQSSEAARPRARSCGRL